VGWAGHFLRLELGAYLILNLVRSKW
jgi:hypothetical protein